MEPQETQSRSSQIGDLIQHIDLNHYQIAHYQSSSEPL